MPQKEISQKRPPSVAAIGVSLVMTLAACALMPKFINKVASKYTKLSNRPIDLEYDPIIEKRDPETKEEEENGHRPESDG